MHAYEYVYRPEPTWPRVGDDLFECNRFRVSDDR